MRKYLACQYRACKMAMAETDQSPIPTCTTTVQLGYSLSYCHPPARTFQLEAALENPVYFVFSSADCVLDYVLVCMHTKSR